MKVWCKMNVTKDREKYIGGSDIPTILNINPFKSRYDLLLEKAELMENDFEGNEYTEFGNAIEPQIRDFLNKEYKTTFEPSRVIKKPYRVHTDGCNEELTVEIKSTSQIKEDVKEYKSYIVQLLLGMMLNNHKKGVLAIYKRPEDFNTNFDKECLTIFEIDIEDYQDWIKEIKEETQNFLKDLDRVKKSPLISEEDLINNEVVVLSNKVVEFEKKLAEYKDLKKQYDEMRDKLYNAMEKENIKKWETNSGNLVTLVKPTADKMVKVLDEKKLKKDKLYNKYLLEKEKKGRKGYVKITLKE